MDNRESRTLRERHRAFERLLDRAQSDRPPLGAARRLVQVFEEHTLPTDPDRLYACHPAEIDGDESEGASFAVVADTSVTMYVDVIGQAPASGQNLIATAVGGRWVAELTAGCGGCTIPATNLHIAWSGGTGHAAGSSTFSLFTINPLEWFIPDVGIDSICSVTGVSLSCLANKWALSLTSDNCDTCVIAEPDTITCEPLELTFHTPGSCQIKWGTWTITPL